MKLTEKEKAAKAAKEMAELDTRRAIVAGLDEMVKKHGIAAVRRVCNNYIRAVRLQVKARREIDELEKKLAAARAKLPR